MSMSVGSIVAGSIAAGLWEEDEEDSNEGERTGGTKEGEWRVPAPELFRVT
jgi:hypothetical protein